MVCLCGISVWDVCVVCLRGISVWDICVGYLCEIYVQFYLGYLYGISAWDICVGYLRGIYSMCGILSRGNRVLRLLYA